MQHAGRRDPAAIAGSLPERRRHPRWNVKVSVQELLPESHVMCATSVSASGLFFPDAVPRPRGVPVVLEIELPGGGPPLRVIGRIVHCGRGEHGMGVAVEFDAPQPRLEAALRPRPS